MYAGIRSLSEVWWLEEKLKNLSSGAHLIHVSTKQGTSRHKLDESWCEQQQQQQKTKRGKQLQVLKHYGNMVSPAASCD